MNNYSIRTKLLFGFGLVLLLLIGVGVVGLYCLSMANNYSDAMGTQKDIKSDAEKIDAHVYQMRHAAMRGLYNKDVRYKSNAEKDQLKTYRDYLDGRIEMIYADVEKTVAQINGRYDPQKPADAENIKACEEIKKLFRDYADLTTDWAGLQDRALDSAAKRMGFADTVEASIEEIVQRNLASAEAEQRMVEIDGKEEPYTHKRLADRLQKLGYILEQVELSAG